MEEFLYIQKNKIFQKNIIKNNDLKLYEKLVNDYSDILKKELLETEIYIREF